MNLGIGRIIVESDAKEVVSAFNSSSYDDSVLGHLIDEVKFLLSSNFLEFKYVFVSRDCNRAAHELAALGYSCTEGEEIITDSLPEIVSVVVANDLLVVE